MNTDRKLRTAMGLAIGQLVEANRLLMERYYSVHQEKRDSALVKVGNLIYSAEKRLRKAKAKEEVD